MRTRLTRWAMSPRTPQAIAHRLTEAAALLLTAAVVALLASGLPGHLFAAGLVHAATALGTVAA